MKNIIRIAKSIAALALAILAAPRAEALTVTTTAGNGSISLAWTAEAGATAYRVEHATTSGGPYAELASGLAATTYTHTGVASGGTNYYVVTASTPGGDVASAEVMGRWVASRIRAINCGGPAVGDFAFGTTNATDSKLADPSVSFGTGAITIEATDAEAQWPDNGGEFTIRRPETMTNAALTVAYEPDESSTAVAGVHYEPLSGSLTLAEGEASATIDVTPRFVLDAPDTTLVLDLLPGPYVLDMNTNAEILVRGSASTRRLWTGNGSDDRASTPENWAGNTVPTTGEGIEWDNLHFGNAQTNVTWDLDVTIGDWVQTTNYTGTITFETKYPDSLREQWGYAPLEETFTNVMISGNCLLEGGTWTHTYNPDVNDDQNRLAVAVSGTFTLENTSGIDVSGRGFWGTRGPGGGTDTSDAATTVGASHGGQGGHGAEAGGSSRTYGCFETPLRLGSGGGKHSGGSRGGGAVDIRVNGAAILNGNILANGIVGHGWRPAGAGGSIFLTAQSLTGTGRLEAWGASARTGGGGGRVAVHLAQTDDFDALQCDARGGNGNGGVYNRAAAGTIYLQGVDNATTNALLWVDNQGLETEPGWVYTALPAEIVDESVVVNEKGKFAALIITNSAQANLEHTLRMRDLAWIADDARLDLPYGLALLLGTDRPAGFPDLSTPSTNSVQTPVSHGEGWIHPDNGMIIWNDQDYNLPFFAWGGSNGTIDNYDSEAVYAFQSNLTMTAVPDAGYDFLRWLGSIPEGQDPFDPELTLTIIPDLHFMAVMAASAGTRTWVGTNTTALASNGGNWYPEGAPQNGEHIVLNEASYSQTTWDTGIADPLERWQAWIHHSVDVSWDHDFTAASWTQTEYYTGTVTFDMGYPDSWREAWGYAPLGETFTNLVISGDCQVEAGTWTHPENPDVEDDRKRLAVRVGGSFTLAESAGIDVSGQGFRELRGPGGGNDTSDALISRGASHGGHGGHGVDAPDAPSPTYGSFLTPFRLGSGGGKHSGHYGGGAVALDVSGTATIHGNILANGVKGHDWRPGPAGGSIFLKAASLAGSGRLEAWGVSSRTGGGGGRIAVHLSDANDFGGLAFDARGGTSTSGGPENCAAAGTVYLEGMENGQRTASLVIDNQGQETVSGWVFTPIPSDLEDLEAFGGTLAVRNGPFGHVFLRVVNHAQAGLNEDVYMNDLFMQDENTRLLLGGHTLFLCSPCHGDWGDEAWVDYAGGEIVWSLPGTLILLQ